VSVLPTWLQVFAQYSPATYVLEDARRAADGAPTITLWQSIAPLIVMGAIMFPRLCFSDWQSGTQADGEF